MRKQIWIAGLIVVMALGLALFTGCSKSEKKEMVDEMHEGSEGHEGHDMMDGSGLSWAYTAETLYTCNHHGEEISKDADAKCSMCGAEMVAMKPSIQDKLQSGELKGCPMCNQVWPKDIDQMQCTKCKMKLVDVPHAKDTMAGGKEEKHEM